MRPLPLLAAVLLLALPASAQKIPNTTDGSQPSFIDITDLPSPCQEGEVPKSAGGNWSCGTDATGEGGAADTTCNDAGVTCLFAAAATEGGAATSATEGAVTAHEAALAIAWGQLTGVPSSFTPSAHASTHAAAGSDPVTITEAQISDLAHTVDTTCEDGPCSLAAGTTLNGAVIQTGADDDVPEAGDYTNLTAGRSLTKPTEGTIDADPELYERTAAINIDPSHSTTDWLMFRAPRNIVVTGIDCVVAAATSVVATVRECDANGANCTATEAAITCGTTNSTEAGAIDDPNIDAGDYVRILRGTVTGTPGQLSLTIVYEAAD